ncbi:MAG: GH36-type glycosyl hydrolase domain-containing protein [Gemmataceae bacterium]
MNTKTLEQTAPSSPPSHPISSSWHPDNRDSIRGESGGFDALDMQARLLARACHTTSRTPSEGPLLQRLARNGRVLMHAYHRIAASAGTAGKNGETIGLLTPDAEWLLDNFYIVEEVLREVRLDLPRGYYRKLPKLAGSTLAGYPRVYALALALIAHTDSNLDDAHIARFVQAFQTAAPLTIGELWAVPTMLRLGLLENLCRLSEQMSHVWDERRRAEAWVQTVVSSEWRDGSAPIRSHRRPDAAALTSDSPPSDPFVVRALELLRQEALPAALEQVEAIFTRLGLNVADIVRRENQRQAVNQVSVANCMTSLRLLSALDWNDFFERTNLVEPMLREDPAGAYSKQDFATRDRYRQIVEKLARKTGKEEFEIARRVVQRARGQDAPRNHVGYYLIGPGRTAFQKEVGYRPGLGEHALETILKYPHSVYFGSIAALLTLFLGLIFFAGSHSVAYASGSYLWLWLLAGLAALVPVSELAVGLTNYLLTLVLPPRILPRLDFKDGIPEECAAFVVVPSMLTTADSAEALASKLEIHYLSNPDPQLRFAVLTDFADAQEEHRPEDDGYVRDALERIAALNRRYAPDGPPRFFLFHRKRVWNPTQGCWMGWERKRGKLEEFNRLLRGAGNTSYTVRSAPPYPPQDGGGKGGGPRVRYVITLDFDTQMPHASARRLIGTLAHPLNQPRFDARQGRVVEGYGVLQPRVSFHLPAAQRSLFTRVSIGSAGIDPYSAAVSDIYQDLFGTGSFTGKGIYDIDAFASATGDAFPDNHILSHDLIEGNYARCGLATDIELYDDFPARYHVYARREHRWVRGDWQLLPWLGRTVPTPALGHPAEHVRRPNPLPLLERWKIFDNLRRSLVPPALVIWLLLSWTVLPLPLGLASALVLLVLALPLLMQVGSALFHTVKDRSPIGLRDLARTGWATTLQSVLNGVVLLFQAYLSVDAIVRTLARLAVTRRHFLEWETAASADRRLGASLKDFVNTMWPAAAASVAFAALVLLARPDALAAASGFLAAWFVSPLFAWWISLDRRSRQAPLSEAERRELGVIARKTWGFFESFVGAEDHWLPPDNFQEQPLHQVAHRTSPTNQGLLLVSTLAAHDLGYIYLGALLERLEKTLETLDRLERHRGHFYNWYDTRTLEPLQPTYVSTVDSGNLLGCLLTLKQGLLDKTTEPLLGATVLSGLCDTVQVMREAVPPSSGGSAEEARQLRSELESNLKVLEAAARETPSDLPAWAKWLEKGKERASALAACVRRLVDSSHQPAGDLELWSRRLADRFGKREAELLELAPWLPLLADPRAAGLVRAGSVSDGQPVANASGSYLKRWQTVRARLVRVFSLADFEANRKALLNDLDELVAATAIEEQARNWLSEVREAVERSSVPRMLERCHDLAARAEKMGAVMDFRFLYKTDRHLFSIGYNVAQEKMDSACYDLLASEARLASFLAIARGEAPPRHWFYLRRAVVRGAGQLCLVSWTGTMFEYLMPHLFLRRYSGTLLKESCAAAVAEQISYGRKRRVPWGISESAFSSHSASFDYQYQAFGVPTLGLKRGLAEDLVIAPYATALASMIRPHEALRNFRYLAAEGAVGKYGFYEAVDYTRSRLPENHRALVVRCFMAHHQGMSLVALANCLLGDIMVRRFHTEPMVRATELLLQERVPSVPVPVDIPDEEIVPRPPGPGGGPDLLCRQLTTPNTPGPRTHLLSGGHYLVMVTNAGSGFSRCGGDDVTRWRDDFTRDNHGQFFYIRDLTSGILWSAAHQPVCRPAKQYEVVYSADKADFRRTDGAIATHLEITVATEHCAEVRRLTLTNHDRRPHEMEITSYAELVLAPHQADLAHPAFGKLFLETEWVASHGALLCRRRPRSSQQEPIWAVHVVGIEGDTRSEAEYETDRLRFLGRGRTPAAPAALEPGARLSGTTGPVLDPIFSIRRRFRLEAGATISLLICTGVAKSREAALGLADHYGDGQAVARVFDLAWAHSQVELRHLQITTADVHLFQRLATHLLYASQPLRAKADVLAANRQGQAGLWRYGISGDNPILLVHAGALEDLPLVRHLLAAHAYWHMKNFTVDLVILCEHAVSYIEELFQKIQEAVRSCPSHALADKPGGVFVRKGAQMPKEDQILLQFAARVVLFGRNGTLSRQLAELVDPTAPASPVTELFKRKRRQRKARGTTDASVELPPDLLFANGFGGFTPDGREYCILVRGEGRGAWGEKSGAWRLARGEKNDPSSLTMRHAPHATRHPLPPAPWVNVVANPRCGFLVSESGLGCTWTGNSQQFRLTPWSNDPTSDPLSEIVYLRDHDSGEVWTPTPRPLGLDAATLVRHGQGYTRFEQRSHGLTQELRVFAAAEEPIKMIALRVWNSSGRGRRLSVTYYAEWVLGSVRDQALMNVRTHVDDQSGALLADNPFVADFAEQVAFVDVNVRPRAFTCDRTEFLGRNGSVEAPAVLGHAGLSGRVGPGLDPCAAVQTTMELPPGEEREVVFFLGSAKDVSTVRELLRRYKEVEGALAPRVLSVSRSDSATPSRVRAVWEEVRQRWDHLLTAVQVQTPDPAVDVLVNRWLVYQVLSCRVWGRSAFYQSSGAYGFRDQLQDVMALAYGAPEETRAQILRAASRQFTEGDVQHWWHPPSNKGVRTRITDDFLWLPFVVCHYVTVSGDTALLDEKVPFLSAPPLKPDQEEDYGQPQPAGEAGTIYEHCVRALKNGLHFGPHGLPLMGSGDWNDGMNKIGVEGKGESVWNGWFLLTCLRRFAELADARGDAVWANTCREQAERLRTAIEEHAWDGSWYRRAYFDDGTPLGSSQNDECQIDSIAQSWAVISGAADPERARQALAAVDEKLVRRDPGMILLFAPPFDKGHLHPGYIKGYVPGIRENGGQYTHASTWTIDAAALFGQGERAKEYFDLLNPIKHSLTPEDVERYTVEPYVAAGDVYGHPPHVGRGGWTWYTGSAAWLYRVMLESILGFHLSGDRLRVEPCIPKAWPSFTITYRYRTATYRIRVENPRGIERGVSEVQVDGQRQEGKEMVLRDDGQAHEVRVVLGEAGG